MPIVTAIVVLAPGSALAPSGANAATDPQVVAARERAIGWLTTRQQENGSLGSSRGLDAAWGLLGLAGAGVHAADLRPGGAPDAPSAQDYYAGLWAGTDDTAWSSSGAMQASDYARTALIAGAAGVDPTRIAPHRSLTAKLARFWKDGYFTSRTALLNQTIFGLLALEQDEAVPPAFVEQLARSLEAAQLADGGYSFVTAETQPTVPGGPSPLAVASGDIDFTGAAIAALCGAGRTLANSSVSRAIAFLRSKRLASGAIGSSIGNVDSNAWALQGLGACGLRQGSAAWDWTADGAYADGGFEATVDWLLTHQRADGGWAIYPEMATNPPGGVQSANAYATQDALRALIDDPGFAVDPPARAAPGDPTWRPTPAVSVGAPITMALAIDAGFGERKLCEVPAVEGATLRETLEAGRTTATPIDCVRDPRWEAGALTTLNGRRTATPAGGWRWSLDGTAAESGATETRTVSAGQVVSLRLEAPSPEVVGPSPEDPDPDPNPDPEDPDPEDPNPEDPNPEDPDPIPGDPAPNPEDPRPEPPPGVPDRGPIPGPNPVVPPFTPASTAKSATVRTVCRRTSHNRAIACTVRTTGRLTVTATVPGRKAVRKTGRRRVVTVVRSPEALRSTQRIRLRIAVGQRSRVITVRANGRTVTTRI